jgi:hypothetical protein
VRSERRTTISLRSCLVSAARFEMTSEPQELGSIKCAARLPEIEFAVILSRAIQCIENNPAQLRNAVYELARTKLRREIDERHPLEAKRLTFALDSAIEGVETIYSKHDELRALRSLHGLIESAQVGQREIKQREPLLIINHPATHTGDINHRAKDASMNADRFLRWPGAAPLLRGAMVGIFALTLAAIVSQFGRLERKSTSSAPVQAQSAPITPPAVTRIQDAFSHLRFANAGATPAVTFSDAVSYSGHHDTRTVASDEQPVKQRSPGCSTQSYKVPSESGGEVSINVLRC